jgi:hypothetical protein
MKRTKWQSTASHIFTSALFDSVFSGYQLSQMFALKRVSRTISVTITTTTTTIISRRESSRTSALCLLLRNTANFPMAVQICPKPAKLGLAQFLYGSSNTNIQLFNVVWYSRRPSERPITRIPKMLSQVTLKATINPFAKVILIEDCGPKRHQHKRFGHT